MHMHDQNQAISLLVQGVSCLGLGTAALTTLFTDLCNMAAFDSLVAGLMPPMDRRSLDNLLASFGCGVLLGVALA